MGSSIKLFGCKILITPFCKSSKELFTSINSPHVFELMETANALIEKSLRMRSKSISVFNETLGKDPGAGYASSLVIAISISMPSYTPLTTPNSDIETIWKFSD